MRRKEVWRVEEELAKDAVCHWFYRERQKERLQWQEYDKEASIYSVILRGKKRYSKMEQEAVDCTLWRNHFESGYGPVTRQTTQWMNPSNTLVNKHKWRLTHNVDSIHADAESLDLVKDYLEQTKNKTVMCYLTSIQVTNRSSINMKSI